MKIYFLLLIRLEIKQLGLIVICFLFRFIGIFDSSYTWPGRGMPGDQGHI